MGLMTSMMFESRPSRFDFAETVAKVRDAAEENGWTVPQVLDLQGHYHHVGLTGMCRATIVYYCNAKAGFDITEDDATKPMLVMMPTGVAVYETSSGKVRVAHMNFSLMRHMFSGVVKKALSQSARNMENALASIDVS
ncbi:MAG: DUF302 domain-containing protein [Gammaproteobacteria bacterium]|nr:DUF302 domain-containing protein [Gammaproteobacteria bacterium]